MGLKEKIKLGFQVTLFLSSIAIIIWFPTYAKDLLAEIEQEEYVREQEHHDSINTQHWCDSNRNYTKVIDFDLIEHYNMTCEQIKFNIDNWVKVYDERKVSVGGGGLFTSTKYQYIKEYKGKGTISLKRRYFEYTYPVDKDCWYTGGSGTNTYLEQDFINYYSNNCVRT